MNLVVLLKLSCLLLSPLLHSRWNHTSKLLYFTFSHEGDVMFYSTELIKNETQTSSGVEPFEVTSPQIQKDSLSCILLFR